MDYIDGMEVNSFDKSVNQVFCTIYRMQYILKLSVAEDD